MNPLAMLQQMSLYPQQNYQGLLSEEQLAAARKHGMLNMGASMLANSGWSPQKRGLGQIIGQGVMQGSAAQGQALQGAAQMQMMKQMQEQKQAEANRPKWDERRIGNEVVQGYAYPDGRFEPVGVGSHFAPKDPRAPTMQQRREGMEIVYERWNPQTQKFEEVGRGPVTGLTEQDVGTGQPRSEPQSIVPPDIDASEAAGLGGFLRGAVNTLGDAFGMGLAYPGAEQARFAMNNLKLYTVTALQAPIPGRPSVHLQQMIEKNTVDPNKILMGEGRAISSYTQMKYTIDTEIARMERDVLNRPMSQSKRNEVEENYSQLRQISKSYDEAIKSFGSKTKGDQTVSPDVDDILKRRGL